MRQLSFTISEDDSLDGAVTAYVREWILVTASALPKGKRGVVALAKAMDTPRHRLTRWLDALNLRSQIEDI